MDISVIIGFAMIACVFALLFAAMLKEMGWKGTLVTLICLAALVLFLDVAFSLISGRPLL